MLTDAKVIALYVDRSSGQWIALDRDGNLWVVPVGDNAWEHRRPFFLKEDTELELVPKHYQTMLGLPF